MAISTDWIEKPTALAGRIHPFTGRLLSCALICLYTVKGGLMRRRFPHKPVIKAVLAAVAICLFAAVMASGWALHGATASPVRGAPQAGWAWNFSPDSASPDSAQPAGAMSLTPG
jgi:hypothetical protein